MAIKIPSLNIRRLYTKEENDMANIIHSNNRLINDILTLKKLKELKRIGKSQTKDLSDLPLNDFIANYNSEYVDDKTGEIKEYRDAKKVKKVEKFVSNNESKISKDIIKTFSRNDELIKALRKENKSTKEKLGLSLSLVNKNRELKCTFKNDYVALSNSALSSALQIEDDTVSDDIIILVIDQEDMMSDVILHDFTFKGVKYELYGASAGQLRKKKVMFVNTNKLKIGIQKLINGLTIDKINSYCDENGNYGVNINKWSAYMSLPTSATEIWNEVNLRRVCVVDDFETILKNREVTYIDNEYNIHETTKDVKIPHTDGFGMMHPKFCRDTRIIRAPWIKGLLSPMDYRSFAKTFDGNYYVEDLWKIKHNLDDIDIILTKSQFKMWKYYESWDEYVDLFYENQCEFRFMIPESKKDLRLNALFNYQMWQTLAVDNPIEVAEKFLEKDMNLIERAHSEVGAMQNMFGVDKDYNRNSYINKALYLYPQMLHHNYFKKSLNDNLAARKSDLAEGRIKINGVYTFIIPDTFAWCEHLLLEKEEPEGLLKDGEVSCKLVQKNKEILVNRSPHLYAVEHCVKDNIKDKVHIRWFISKGVYTSIHDMISKRLFFDVDGDIALVIDNDELVDLAKKTTKDLKPLDFELGKAKPQIINRTNILQAYKDSFKANIGYYSNLITKVMNSDNKDLDLVAKFCWMNNMAIDMAKTNFFIEPPDELNTKLKELDSTPLPYFFHWAKKKSLGSVNPPNDNSLVDNMAKYVFGDLTSSKRKDRKYTRFNYRSLSKFDKRIMMINENIFDNEELTSKLNKKIREISDTKYHTIVRKRMQKDDDFTDIKSLDVFIKTEMYDFISENQLDVDDVVDYYIDYCFEKNLFVSSLFTIFGTVIVDRLEQRFPELIDGTHTRCEICGKEIPIESNRTSMCKKCFDKQRREYKTRKQKEYRIL